MTAAVVREPRPPKALLRSGEVARLFAVDTRTVARWADEGLIPVVVLPSGHRRFRPEDVDAAMREAAS